MPRKGMDVEVVEGIAKSMSQRARSATSIVESTGRLIRGSEKLWLGQRADQWLADWQAEEAAVRRAAGFLEEMSHQLIRQADEQRVASGGHGDRSGSEHSTAGRIPPDPNEVIRVALGLLSAAFEPLVRAVKQAFSGLSRPVPAPPVIDLSDDALDETTVSQGSFGDCWFIAAVGAVAGRDPGAIRKGIRSRGGGNYTVTLYDKVVDGNGRVTMKPVEIDVEFVEEKGAGAPGKDRGKNFASIYESALEQHKGDLNGGGSSGEALEMITGRPARIEVDPNLPSIDEIERGLKEGRIYTAGTVDHGFTDIAGNFELGPTPDPTDKEMTHVGLVPNHAYMIDEVRIVNGTKMIHVVNPWGPGPNSQDAWSDGWIDQQEFRDNFESVASVAGGAS